MSRRKTIAPDLSTAERNDLMIIIDQAKRLHDKVGFLLKPGTVTSPAMKLALEEMECWLHVTVNALEAIK